MRTPIPRASCITPTTCVFFERARTEWLRDLGLSQEHLAAEQGLRFVVRRATLYFAAAARLDDLLQMTVRILKFACASLDLEQEVLNRGRRICAATVQIACLHGVDFRPVAIPDNIRTRMMP